MADQLETTDIQRKYAQQYANDLQANRQRQGDLNAQIAGLKEDLERLKWEEVWLTQAQGSLPGGAGSSEPIPGPAPTAAHEEPESAADVQTVPTQRHEVQAPGAEKSAGRATKKTRAKRMTLEKATAAQKTPVKKTAAKPEAGRAPAAGVAGPAESPVKKAVTQEKAGPTLWQLAWDILLKTPGQPCVAREVAEQLALEHPGRAATVQIVRNSLETLVKKGLADRTQQQRSVMYTANAATAAGSEGNASVGSEPEHADATEPKNGQSPARA
ncbi:hypothetical protein YW3DRAFT_07123 [Streptomyces sp. MnatMP-M77]|uniref:hypothetical protein n=1 Tax=unclassified Streptomyces TaxID=2593676 RepID=UPI0008048150|nr:hypothetical protein [Streptomyces sp. MnatMP-M77]MYT79297.1 hypothetical protein [Streptomyces sp. SID8364]SBV03787.1 hypothetical protein YW3DRAFT_07123 [Streptomyces sp. MnatMP-M77]